MVASFGKFFRAREFAYIEERADEFLALFPHRESYLYAAHPLLGQPVHWHTETRHPLSDRLINQGAFLYGVRFSSRTNYLLLDIDRKSVYHPYRDTQALSRILAALEPLGLCSYVAVSSSYSAGVHLYFPFAMSQPCWAIAQAAECLLANRGFKLQNGQLEIFPNPRVYSAELSEYCGHRLPLQAGSYLLDSDWQPTWSDRSAFVESWRHALNRNLVSEVAIQQVFRQSRRENRRAIRGNARKFLSDLNADIEAGWTGYGQTNRILGRIAMREYIFGHVLHGGTPLEGEQLAAHIFGVAESLPGFEEWSRHQHDIVDLCRYWANAVERSHYYRYGERHKPKPEESPKPNLNDFRAAEARSRIRQAVAEMLETDSLPSGTRARLMAIRACAKVGSDTCYKNADLWHPERLSADLERDPDLCADPDPEQTLKPLQNKDDPDLMHNKLCGSLPGAPPAHKGSDILSGGSGGFSTDSPDENEVTPKQPAPDERTRAIAATKQLLAEMVASRRRDRWKPLETPPPDETYFEQLTLITVPSGGDSRW